MKLNELSDNPGATKKRKRVGRGACTSKCNREVDEAEETSGWKIELRVHDDVCATQWAVMMNARGGAIRRDWNARTRVHSSTTAVIPAKLWPPKLSAMQKVDLLEP